MTEGDRHRLREVDLVLFKTKHAFDLLSKETKAAALVGFTTVDRRDASVRRIPRTALHVAGWNPHKGTAAILASWSARPDWPEIRVVTQLKGLTGECRNVRVFNTRITDRALRSLQNECTVHVCPSEVEGFGHTLVEAMSCGAVTVTTAAPPMNEVITPEEGFLVPYSRTEPMGAGTRYLVDADSLADVMNRVWTLDSGTFEQLSKAARARFERMQSSFHDSLVTALSGI
ncbi:MAG: glycosyltransferase family 4 protein [Vicinamibacterales bacterium]